MTELPFLDLLLKRINSGGLKLSVYRKPTHTDQYLNFMSQHPIDHKMSVVRTLLERSQNLVSEPEDKKKEDIHVQESRCPSDVWLPRVVISEGQTPDEANET